MTSTLDDALEEISRIIGKTVGKIIERSERVSEALMSVIDKRITDYDEMDSRNDLTETGKHAMRLVKGIKRDMEFALATLASTVPSAYRGAPHE